MPIPDRPLAFPQHRHRRTDVSPCIRPRAHARRSVGKGSLDKTSLSRSAGGMTWACEGGFEPRTALESNHRGTALIETLPWSDHRSSFRKVLPALARNSAFEIESPLHRHGSAHSPP